MIMEVDIKDLPLPSEEFIQEVAQRVGADMLDDTNVHVVRLCSLIQYQDIVIAQMKDEK
jgi:hypothetical protein